MRAPNLYLVGEEALDIARMTDLPLGWLLDRDKNVRYQPRIDWRAVTDVGRDLVYLDLSRVPYWDKMRVAWTRIGGHYYLRASKEPQWDSFSSSPSVSSSSPSSKEESANEPRLDGLHEAPPAELDRDPRPARKTGRRDPSAAGVELSVRLRSQGERRGQLEGRA
jgi:hypothetical protein